MDEPIRIGLIGAGCHGQFLSPSAVAAGRWQSPLNTFKDILVNMTRLTSRLSTRD